MDKLRVLITGVNGFIGQHLFAYLLPNYEVLGLQRSDSQKKGHQKIDFSESSQLKKLFESFQPQVVIHLASSTSRTRSMDDFSLFMESNVELTERLLFHGASLSTPPKFIFLSTSEVYGPQSGSLNETSNLNPVSPYGLSKCFAESVFEYYHRNYGIATHILRLFNTYGPGQSKGFFFADLMSAQNENRVFEMTLGEQKRDFIYIDDVVRAIEMFIHRPNLIEYINLSSGNPVSLNEIVEVFNEIIQGKLKVDPSLPYRSNEIWDLSGNNEKLTELGFALKYSLRDGINALLKSEKN